MPNVEAVRSWSGRELHGTDEEKLGKIDQVYVDRETGQPTFAAVKTGLFGTKSSLVPIDQATEHADRVHVPFAKDQVKDAPNVDADEELSEAEEQRLYAHYGRDYSAYTGRDQDTIGTVETETTGGAWAGTRTGEAPAAPTAGGPGHDTTGPNTDQAMTRSEEELRVGTAARETGRARLRKVIVTEQVQTTVPVSHEEVRVEREPITDANLGAATDGPALSEEEHEVVLHAEEPVVEKRVVPKERVRLETDTVTEEATVDETLRKEQVEADGDTPR